MEGQGSLRTDGNRQDRWAALQDEKEIDGVPHRRPLGSTRGNVKKNFG